MDTGHVTGRRRRKVAVPWRFIPRHVPGSTNVPNGSADVEWVPVSPGGTGRCNFGEKGSKLDTTNFDSRCMDFHVGHPSDDAQQAAGSSPEPSNCNSESNFAKRSTGVDWEDVESCEFVSETCNLQSENFDAGLKDCEAGPSNLVAPQGVGPSLEPENCYSEEQTRNADARNKDTEILKDGRQKCAWDPTSSRQQRKMVVPWRFQQEHRHSFRAAFKMKQQLAASEDSERMQFCNHKAELHTTRRLSPGVRVSAQGASSIAENEMHCGFESVKKQKVGEGGGISNNWVAQCLQEYWQIYKGLLEEAKGNDNLQRTRLDLVAFKIFRRKSKWMEDCAKLVGNVPGIKVGDVFNFRVELCVAGLHSHHLRGIDVAAERGNLVATSIVAYYPPENNLNLDVIVYTSPFVSPVDQKIDGPNLALKRSMDTESPVRVIHGFTTYAWLKNDAKTRKISTYIYGGLYQVEKYWRENREDGEAAFMFRLSRIPGQPDIDFREILQSKMSDASPSFSLKDLSHGLEKMPVSVVNSVDDEQLEPFIYMTKLRYPLNHLPKLPIGCDCTDGCSDSEKCACAVKNGGELPFNHSGLIVQAKPLVYECGPFCQCPPTCHNRVGQHGIRFRLEIFKTRSMGWGVRSKDFIPSGSFVCEYIGEVLEEEVAQQRCTDEYLFAIGNNYYDDSLWSGLSRSIPSLQQGPPAHDHMASFAVDTSQRGNVAKFINHSCSPNMYVQNSLYDHDSTSMPHLMFYASEDIPAFQELSYHYNYTIDAVYDSDGNIKKKKCFCGTADCTGWLY